MLMRFMAQTDPQTEETYKRRYERRTTDQCVGEIDGQNYPVINWSKGGALIMADDRGFAEGDTIDLTIKFHTQDRIVDIHQTAEVIRKGTHQIGLRFKELSDHAKHSFQQIIDDTMAREFADSQA